MKKILFSLLLTGFCCLILSTTAILRGDEKPNPAPSKPTTAAPVPAFVPLVDAPTLLRPLDRQQPVWVTADRQAVVLGGYICLREGLLEFFACKAKSKEHESIIALDIKPHLIHAALLVIGAKQGSPARFDPVFVPPSGEKIAIKVRWKNEKGETVEVRAQDLILEANSKKPMQSSWVFTGGLFGTSPEGKRYYLADISGEIFGVSNFPGSVLDVPFQSSADNDSLFFEPNTEKIPPIGTPVTILLNKEGI